MFLRKDRQHRLRGLSAVFITEAFECRVIDRFSSIVFYGSRHLDVTISIILFITLNVCSSFIDSSSVFLCCWTNKRSLILLLSLLRSSGGRDSTNGSNAFTSKANQRALFSFSLCRLDCLDEYAAPRRRINVIGEIVIIRSQEKTSLFIV